MRAWFEQLPTEARWITGGGLLFIVLMILAFALKLSTLLIDNLQQSSRHEPRIARMLGYEETAQELQGASKDFSRALGRLAYSGADDANAAGARLQQTLRGFAEETGLTVVGSQLAVITPEETEDPDEAEGLFDQLAVDLSLDGPPIALDAFLVAIEQQTPALATVSIDIQRKRRSRREGNETLEFLTVRLRIVALRVAA